MTDSSSTAAVCPSCSAPAAGRFCASCGAPLQTSACAGCSAPLASGARFCHRCGKAATISARSSRAGTPAPAGRKSARWIAATVAGVAILAWLAGKAIKPADSAGGMPQQEVVTAAPGAPASAMRGPDISGMSAQERVDRLYRRVMLLDEQGKTDSVLFFAPMAIDAYRMLGPLDEKRRAELDRIVRAADTAAAKALQTSSPSRP